jgi:hypothetical protein
VDRSAAVSPASHRVLDRIGAFIQELQGVQFQVPEDDAAVARSALFAPRLAQEIEQAVALLQAAQEHYERFGTIADEQVADVESLDDIGRMISSEIAGQEVADLLFIARTELKGTLQDLIASIDQEDFLRVASSCDSGLRTLKRTLISVESAIYEFEGMDPPMRQWSDLEISLQTRKMYSDVRRYILRSPKLSDQKLPDHLAGVHDRLDRLRDLEIYPLLRFDDRVTMRELRRRIGSWVIQEPHDLLAGRRLWGDLTGFAELLKEVNHRQELRQHDRALLRRAYHQLFGRASHPAEMPEDMLYQLDALYGLDDELDELLERRDRSDLVHWRQVLTRLLHRLSSTAQAMTSNAAWGN